MPDDMAVDNMQCNRDKTVHTELTPILARETAFEVLGNNTEPVHEIESEGKTLPRRSLDSFEYGREAVISARS